jgi:hypothetical protein
MQWVTHLAAFFGGIAFTVLALWIYVKIINNQIKKM